MPTSKSAGLKVCAKRACRNEDQIENVAMSALGQEQTFSACVRKARSGHCGDAIRAAEHDLRSITESMPARAPLLPILSPSASGAVLL